MRESIKVAVTGASGHLGSNCVRLLIDKGYQVTAICKQGANLDGLEGLNLEKIFCDILDYDRLIEAFCGVDKVVHLAGVISIQGDRDGMVFKTNVQGTQNVCSACLECGVKQLVHISSIHAFQSFGKDWVIDEHTRKAGSKNFAYDRSKAEADRMVLKAREKGLNATILYPTGILGPHDYIPSRAGQLLADLFEGKLPALLNGGFDWVDAGDVASAIARGLDQSPDHQENIETQDYIIAGQWASIEDLAIICEDISGVKAPRFLLPLWVGYGVLPLVNLVSWLTKRPPVLTYESLSILKHSSQKICDQNARRYLGHNPRALQQTISDIYYWYNSRKKQ